jgi:tRNA G10  N-methylase Trm11
VIEPLLRQEEDVTTIQRYAGKTNEAFTHLLVNAALAASGDGFARLLAGQRVRLLDPACGRGTSLNRAIVYGMDAVGIDVDQRDLEAYGTFLLGWLQDKRLKHEVDRARLRKGREVTAHHTTVTYGAGKDRTQHRTLEVVHDDTVAARSHLKARSVDVLVCDLPYGVQHGSSAASGVLQRRPDELVDTALPVWWDLLRPGAGVALAWNLRTLPRARLVELLVEHEFELVVPPDDERFVHRVDRSITRDVVVARRPW